MGLDDWEDYSGVASEILISDDEIGAEIDWSLEDEKKVNWISFLVDVFIIMWNWLRI